MWQKKKKVYNLGNWGRYGSSKFLAVLCCKLPMHNKSLTPGVYQPHLFSFVSFVPLHLHTWNSTKQMCIFCTHDVTMVEQSCVDECHMISLEGCDLSVTLQHQHCYIHFMCKHTGMCGWGREEFLCSIKGMLCGVKCVIVRLTTAQKFPFWQPRNANEYLTMRDTSCTSFCNSARKIAHTCIPMTSQYKSVVTL